MSSLDFSCEAEIVRLEAAIDEQSDKEMAGKKQRGQMLKLVSNGFYNELINYVGKNEVLRVASHLLDNVLAQENKPAQGVEYYNGMFTLASVKDEWTDRKQLAVQHVTLRPLQLADVSKVVTWLKVPAIRESSCRRFRKRKASCKSTSPIRHGNISASTTTANQWKSSAAKTLT